MGRVNESEWMRRIDARLAERSDRRWRATLEEFSRDWDRTLEKLLDRYFGPNGNGSDAGREPGPA